jgi:thiol-disulfide isomerase/thioredoxin
LSFAVSLSQLLLAVIFAIAGVAKLLDRVGTRAAAEAFGVSPRLAPALATGLPIVELGIAVALLPAATVLWGALAAAVLLVIFSVAVARSLRAGSTPDCNCFGGLTQAEVGRGTLARNLLLAALSAVVALGSSRNPVSAFHWIAIPAPADRAWIALLVVCVIGLAAFCWQLLRQNGRLLLRLDAEGLGAAPAQRGALSLPPLQPGSTAPAFSGRDLDGEPVSLKSLRAPGHPIVLFFTDPGCGACELVLDAVAQAQRERADELTVAVISSGSIDRIEAKATEFGLDRVIPQDGEDLLDAYRVHGFPAVIEIDPGGSITKEVALGPKAVREMVLGDLAQADGKPLGLAAR